MFLMGFALAVWIPSTRETRDPPEGIACPEHSGGQVF